MQTRKNLQAIANLSAEFGSDAYVRGGGGNTSCKNEATLFVKPSGTSLGQMTPENFLPLSRAKLGKLYNTDFPADETAREREVVAFMADTVEPGATGRPSVEAPLHNVFPHTYVVHTHPASVNGLTCAVNGPAACAELFPDALWVPFVEPGYTLCMRVRAAMLKWREDNGVDPHLLFLGNHGVFIAHDDEQGVRDLYRRVMDGVGGVIEKAGLSGQPDRAADPQPAIAEAVARRVREIMGDDAAGFAAMGRFAVPEGALTPDHIVYCRPELYVGAVDAATLRRFREEKGYWPRVIATSEGVFGFGSTPKVADLALELAWDGAMVVRYAKAFGGVRYLEKQHVDFIANWEVESYRQKVSQ